MPKVLKPNQVPTRGNLPSEVDLTLECYVERADGTFVGYAKHRIIEEVMDHDDNDMPLRGSMCERCGWTPYGPGYPR